MRFTPFISALSWRGALALISLSLSTLVGACTSSESPDSDASTGDGSQSQSSGADSTGESNEGSETSSADTTSASPGDSTASDMISDGSGSDSTSGVGDDSGSDETAVDPKDAEPYEVDRFSKAAGTLMVRGSDNNLPAAGKAVDFDKPPFITRGLSPSGAAVEYYNFDVQSATPARVYRMYRETDGSVVNKQLDIFDKVPGDDDYSDFHLEVKVMVDKDYIANTYTSLEQLQENALAMEETMSIVNLPIVPAGSSAKQRWEGASTQLELGWFDGKTVGYFEFETLSGDETPTSPIYVLFNKNPDETDGGPASGFQTEEDGVQTHNVVATLPGDSSYSPLWSVQVLDKAAFSEVRDLDSAQAAEVVVPNMADVNCPVVVLQKTQQVVPTTKAELDKYLEAGDYKDFLSESEVHASTGPHGNGVKTYFTDSLQESLLAGNSEHPIGAAAIKELYDGDTIDGWAVLVKVRDDGPEELRYYWYEILGGTIYADGEDEPGCSDCHSGGKDFVLTPAIK